MKAVKKAVESGADYAEIDVQLSKDGIPVVIHDKDMKRLAGLSKKVEEMTVEELQKLTIHSNGREGTIPTLGEMIKAVKSTGNKTGLLVELKPAADNKSELAKKVIQTVEEYQAASVSSCPLTMKQSFCCRQNILNDGLDTVSMVVQGK